MKIAQIAPLAERVPPKKYGGTERVIYNLTEELVKRGHEVTLFASGDSTTSAKLISVFPKSLREAKIKDLYGANTWDMLNIGLAYQMQDQFDIIHDHNPHISLPTANLSKTPVVVTIHGSLIGDYKYLYSAFDNIGFVSISKAQRNPTPNLNYIGNVYNGLPMDDYPFSDKHWGYLLIVGRISEEKGTHYAIKVAQALDMPLIIAAKLDQSNGHDIVYYEKNIKPFLSKKIKWVGEVDEKTRNELMSKAYCSLHPVTWPEPFGLTLIEAMACGAPVVAFSQGSIPEVIAHGKTGYVVNTLSQMIQAVKKVGKIKRINCRVHATQNFSAKKMADGYEQVYNQILSTKYYKENFIFTSNVVIQSQKQKQEEGSPLFAQIQKNKK
jgi:glycosyltransferase involved in cell wall biosynthesis